MGALEEQIARTFMPGMYLPEPLKKLFAWIESNGLFLDDPSGKRIGFLYPDDKLKNGSTETDRPGGTTIEFSAEGNADLKYWFGHERPEVINRLCVFAKTGSDGSMAALWLNPRGEQSIVHLGSGSGSTMVCVLAQDPLDFLRLLAIGYDEICWGQEEYSSPPSLLATENSFVVHPNREYQEWLKSTFGVTIPECGAEVVKYPEGMGQVAPQDSFNKWVAQNAA